MKRKLTADALDLLAVAAISGWPLQAEDLRPAAELVMRGLVAAEGGPGVVLIPTTAGVRTAIVARAIVQNGTRFALAPGFAAKRQRQLQLDIASPAAPPSLRIVAPAAPDPFKEGMDAAIAGQPEAGPYAGPEAQDWAAGYQAGISLKAAGTI